MKTITTDELEELRSPNPSVKYIRAKQLIARSRIDPASLYPHFEFFASLLENENNILRWTAIDILGRCAIVDDQKKVDALLPKFVRYLRTGKLITANHAISAMTDVARAKTYLGSRVVRQLLKIEAYSFETDECKHIVLGKTIDAFSALQISPGQLNSVAAFVERQRTNPRPATKKRAERYLQILNRKGDR